MLILNLEADFQAGSVPICAHPLLSITLYLYSDFHQRYYQKAPTACKQEIPE